jgi:PAS domain S-box-containing protein
MAKNFRPDLETIIAKGGLIIFIWSAAEGWQVEYVSKNISSFGYSREDFYSGDIIYEDIVHPDDIERVRSDTTHYTNQKCNEFQQEYRILTKEREIRWVDDRTIVRYDEKGEPTHFEGIIIDITEKKQIQQDLIESQKHFRALLENIPVSLQLFDSNGLLLYGNTKWEELYDVKRDNLIKLKYNVLRDKQLKKSGITDMVREILKGKDIKLPDLEYDPSKSDYHRGRKRWIRTQVYPLRDNNQNLKYFVIMAIDITEQKKMDEEQLKTQRLESIAMLAGGIAHDFNNILVGILGNINLMQMETLSSNLKEYLGELEKATFRARDLTSQLLTFSKGGTPIKKVESITEIIRDSINLVLRGSKSKSTLNYAMNLPNVEVDFGQISQTINNLLINASQAMPNGGTIDIEVSLEENFENSEKHLSKNNYVKVSIKDEGNGIPREIHDQIFTPYFTTKTTGSGLGLATAYSIIKQHGGYIDFFTSEGGTTFYFYLPTTEKNRTLPTETNTNYQQLAGKILIMDDDPMVSRTLGAMLKKLGFSVEESRDGKETLQLYDDAFKKSSPFDLVIMDLTIPGGMGGEETIKQLKQSYPHVNVVVSSGYANNPILANYQEWGFLGILQKPYTISKVRQLISSIFGK